MSSVDRVKWFPLGTMSLLLSACGGSGGGVESTPTPTPTPVNFDVTDLKVSQTFTVPSGKNGFALETTKGSVETTTVGKGEVAIAYNASSGTYTLTRNGMSKAFAPSDLAGGSPPGERRFSKSDASGSDHLTLVDTSYASNLKTRSVGLGYWQSITGGGGRQNTAFDIFVYGFPTASAAVPRTGSAQYTTDVFGLTTQVGSDPLTFAGSGKTMFDFDRGKFTIDTNLEEYYFVTGAERYGALYFRASGNLTSGDGNFSGSFIYDGSLDSVAGSLNGRFYGPNAEEAGGTFNGDNGAGGTVVGAFTAGNRTAVSDNMTLSNLQRDQLFYTGQSRYFAQQFKDGSDRGYASADLQNGQLHYEAGSGYRIAGYSAEEGKFVEANRIDTAADRFAIYRKTVDGEDIQLSLYKTSGGALNLTYASFGEYYRVPDTSEINGIYRTFFMYGIDTPEGVLTARPGSATYSGIAYGAAGAPGGQEQLKLSGTSQFQIDFPSQGYSGWLKLQGTSDRNGSAIDFGRFDLVGGKGFPRNAFTAGLAGNPGDHGDIQLRFYGPTGEEMAGVFAIRTANGFVLGGATAAVRQ